MRDAIRRIFWSPLTFFVGGAGLVVTLFGFFGVDLRAAPYWGWIVAAGFFSVWLNAQVRGDGDGRGGRPVGLTIVNGEAALRRVLFDDQESVVRGARELLYVAGSRSRDDPYMRAIATHLTEHPTVRHLRLLVGPPAHAALLDHLGSIMAQRESINPDGRLPRIEIGMHPLGGDLPERFLTVSERKAFVVLPSITSPKSFDTALLIEDATIAGKLAAALRSAVDAAPVRVRRSDDLGRLGGDGQAAG